AMEVIVPDDQLSLAIGKKGQNVRLASRLSTWKLDVRSDSEAEDEARRARTSLTAIPNVGDVTAELLYQYGFKSAEELAASDEEAVAEIDGIDPERAGTILAAARRDAGRARAARGDALGEVAPCRSAFTSLQRNGPSSRRTSSAASKRSASAASARRARSPTRRCSACARRSGWSRGPGSRW